MNFSIEKATPLKVELNISEPNIVQYLSKFESPLREAKAEEALKVGVIAILSASPSLDTKVVEEKFNQVDKRIREYTDEFKRALSEDLKNYFEKEKGTLPTTLQSFFGEKGILNDSLKTYFDDKTGKLKTFLTNELGVGSEFAKSLDPNNKSSVITKIEEVVSKRLIETTQGLIDQFSLDKPDSSMTRIKKIFEDSVMEVKSVNELFFAELREHLNIQKAVEEEAEKGTQKGRDFETALYGTVAKIGKQLEDSTENVSQLAGEIERCKTGDFVITLGSSSGSPGKRIVIEAKNAQNYSFKKAAEELKEAKLNRKSDCGIFVFLKGCEPIETKDFQMDGHDFFCTVDASDLDADKALLFLESAYKIARIQLITQSRKEAIGQIDCDGIKDKIKLILSQTDLMTELVSKARTIKNNGEFIETKAKEIKDEIELVIKATLEMLK